MRVTHFGEGAACRIGQRNDELLGCLGHRTQSTRSGG
jgi:hypothetical protein